MECFRDEDRGSVEWVIVGNVVVIENRRRKRSGIGNVIIEADKARDGKEVEAGEGEVFKWREGGRFGKPIDEATVPGGLLHGSEQGGPSLSPLTRIIITKQIAYSSLTLLFL